MIVDRYVYTQLALAIAHGDDEPRAPSATVQHLPDPRCLVLFIDVNPTLAAGRVLQRGRDANTVDFLSRLRDGFMGLPEMRQFQVLDGTADPSTVADQAWRLVAPVVDR